MDDKENSEVTPAEREEGGAPAAPYVQTGGFGDRQRASAMEVVVEHNLEKAMKILKRKLIKEGLFKELKSRRYFEKPCERRKRKLKESMKKLRKEEARSRKNPYF